MGIHIVGVGMGGENTLTAEGKQAMMEADVLIGAERLLAAATAHTSAVRHAAIQPADILRVIEQNRGRNICVLMSGDVGFYSGAKKLIEALGDHDYALIAGLSSVQYFAAKLCRPWQAWKLVSAHGKSCDAVTPVRDNAETFFLTGGALTVQAICRELCAAGFGGCTVTVGERLGSDDERIIRKTAQDLAQDETTQLAVMLVENPTPRRLVSCGFADEAFTRGDIPMTKSEVRSVILSKLCLREDDIVYDIGAGTGSVTVETALLAKKGHVFAFERAREGCQLIAENAQKMKVTNITVVEGDVPQTLEGQPVPDAAFIGGSGGNLEEILELLLARNPKIRLVVSAVALETLGKATAAFFRLPLADVEVSQIAVSRSRRMGGYHMMIAQNPVYVISGTGSPA
ncbi:precorrin-6y C5,15-methyltransferase (decarboxylating) subunit CbiE [Oscillospiraceae bacterium CM]|nr:precorrin-6y C5,15-methyltransferase (decarboxylating) subunit CbiE [Oscillospiraceae bacterium CM]